jgi:chromosome segregation ATPase
MKVDLLTEQLKSQLLELQYRLYSEQQLLSEYREKVLKLESAPEWVDWKIAQLESALEKVKDSLLRLKFLEAEARALDSALLSD